MAGIRHRSNCRRVRTARVRRSVVAKTLKDLEAKRRKLVTDIEQGTVQGPKAVTIGSG